MLRSNFTIISTLDKLIVPVAHRIRSNYRPYSLLSYGYQVMVMTGIGGMGHKLIQNLAVLDVVNFQEAGKTAQLVALCANSSLFCSDYSLQT